MERKPVVAPQRPFFVQDNRRVALYVTALLTAGLFSAIWLLIDATWQRNAINYFVFDSATSYIFTVGVILICFDVLFLVYGLSITRLEFYDDHLTVFAGKLFRKRKLEVSYQNIALGDVRKDIQPWFLLYVKSELPETILPPSSIWTTNSISSPWRIFDKRIGSSKTETIHQWLKDKKSVGPPLGEHAIMIERMSATSWSIFKFLSGKSDPLNMKRRIEVILSLCCLVLGVSITSYSIIFLNFFELGFIIGIFVVISGFFLAYYNVQRAEVENYQRLSKKR
jgi:hypothetical protein